ncbi:hypothetical protein HELRODRAFT_193638 [Helobdella robusta]|uniref:PID domain-containing protein n=1 Tax=Helobdella robusta TaxID=6412 RepID=T1FV79_HELRO|nr:hypothetical protein HELRODRAFT_193638 [Helobdella robusta]ESN95108.1 hypothetical protein HELRODRAFT_193638 [Helobdella robusta]
MALVQVKVTNMLNSLIRQKSCNISERNQCYKVRYLGNVLTAFMKGEGCVDRPVDILWKNFQANENSTLQMELTICGSGLKVETKEQGLTEYRSNKVAYCTCLPKYPKLFIWVYRHEGKKMKVELRCHAVLCKSEEKAKLIQSQLQAKLTSALQEFRREKTRRQNSRLVIQTSNQQCASALPVVTNIKPVRTKYLSKGDNFRLPVEQSNKAPKLTSITEDAEDDDDGDDDDDDDDRNNNNNKNNNNKNNYNEDCGSNNNNDNNNNNIDLVSESVCLNPDVNMSLRSTPSADKLDDDASDDVSNESGFSDEADNDGGKL